VAVTSASRWVPWRGTGWVAGADTSWLVPATWLPSSEVCVGSSAILSLKVIGVEMGLEIGKIGRDGRGRRGGRKLIAT
jgi:hypothetical protein